MHQNHLLLIDDQDDKIDEADDGEGNRPVDDNNIEDRIDASKEKDDKEKGDITNVIEESDSESNFGYVHRTYRYGDAHREESECSYSESRCEDRQVVAENSEEMNEKVSSVEESIDNENVCHVRNHDFHSLFQGDGRNGTMASEEVANDGLEEVTSTSQEQEPHTPEQKSPPKPIPAPRRSMRERRVPQRYDQYVMYRLTNREVDNRLHALDALANSGVLNDMDADTAHRLISAFMK